MNYEWYITPIQYELGLSNGISKSTLTFRVRKYGWDIERAFSQPVKHQNESKEIRLILKNNNVTVQTYKWRMAAGWDAEKALNTPPLSRKEILTLALAGQQNKTK